MWEPLLEGTQYALAVLVSGFLTTIMLVKDRLYLGLMALRSWAVILNFLLFSFLGGLALGTIKTLQGWPGLCKAGWFGGLMPSFLSKILCSSEDMKFTTRFEVILAVIFICLIAGINGYIIKLSGISSKIVDVLVSYWKYSLGLISYRYDRDIDAQIGGAAARINFVLSDKKINAVSFLEKLEQQSRYAIDKDIDQLRFSVRLRDHIIRNLKLGGNDEIKDAKDLIRMMLAFRSEGEVREAVEQAADLP